MAVVIYVTAIIVDLIVLYVMLFRHVMPMSKDAESYPILCPVFYPKVYFTSLAIKERNWRELKHFQVEATHFKSKSVNEFCRSF